MIFALSAPLRSSWAPSSSRSNSSPVPLWLNEGLAELYSTFESEDGKVAIGKPIERHVYWLRDQPLIPLRELFAVDVDSPTYNEGRRQGRNG